MSLHRSNTSHSILGTVRNILEREERSEEGEGYVFL